MNPKLLLRSALHDVLYHSYVKSRMRREVTTTILQRPFLVVPTVFHPRFYYSSRIFVNFIRTLDLVGKKVLDMGTGSGVLAVFAALQGANVTAVDKNPEAVRCAEFNSEKNGVGDKVRVLLGDLFSPLNGDDRFDYMFFNPPFYPREPSSLADLAWKAGKRFRLLLPFVQEAQTHLERGGRIYLIVSSDVSVEHLLELFRRRGYSVQARFKKNLLFERMIIYELVLDRCG